MSKQSELDEAIEQLAKDFAELNEKQTARVAKELAKVRSDIADLLTEYAETDGTIKRRKLNAIVRDMQSVENGTRTYLMRALEDVIYESSTFAVENRNAIFVTVLGVVLLSAAERKKVAETVAKSVVKAVGEDGLNLSDRVWNLSGTMRDELTKVVRTDILKGEPVSTMIRNVRNVHENETWKIRRMVVTEANTTLRRATGDSAHNSEVVTALRLNDNRSRHGNHHKHACYKLAEADSYGLGKGVYPTSERSRLEMPHVQCTSYITDVIDPQYL